MALQNFVDKVGPVVNAAWLNMVDVLSTTVFGNAGAKPAARTALTSDLPFEVTNGGTGARTAGDALTSLGAFPAAGFTQTAIGNTAWPASVEEIAAGSTPVNLYYYYGDIRRFGVTFSGDETSKVQTWANVGGMLYFPVAETVTVSSAITLPSNATLMAAKGATIANVTATHDVSILSASSKSNITISGLKLSYTQAGATPSGHSAGIYLLTCTNCTVMNCEFAGMQFGGVWLENSSNNTVRNNWFHNGTGGGFTNSHDIAVYTGTTSATAQYNLVEGNLCFGGQVVGILVQDGTLSNAFCQYNSVIGNFVKGQTGYGIVVYMTNTAPDTFNKVVGNHVEAIQGSFIDIGPSTQNFGAGIYVQGAGGTLVASNTILNCCINTNSVSLAPAAIGVSNIGTNQAPVSVTGNNIKGMTQYWGILFTGVSGGGTINGNTIEQPSSNTTGDCIKIANSLNISCASNTLVNLNTTTNQLCIAIWAQGASCNLIDVSGNTCNGGFQQQIRTIQTGGNTVAGLTIRGNHCSGGQSGCVPLTLDSGVVVNALVTGNNFRAGASAPAIKLIASTSVRMSENFVTGGNPVLDFSGTSATCFYDKSNVGQGAGAGISNAGTGVIIEVFGTGAIAAGTWAVGDLIRNSAPAAGGVLFSVCTTAGTGGGTAVFKTVSNT